jgi:hypothetical protein
MLFMLGRNCCNFENNFISISFQKYKNKFQIACNFYELLLLLLLNLLIFFMLYHRY